MLRERPEETIDTGLQQRGRAVLAAQGHGQGVAPGGPGGPVGGGLPAGVGRGRDSLTGLGQVTRGLVMGVRGSGRRIGRRTYLGGRPRWCSSVVPPTTVGHLRRCGHSPGLSQGGPGAVLTSLSGP